MEEKKTFIRKLFVLHIGFFLCAMGLVMVLKADLGVGPWETFYRGISLHTGLSFGRISQMVGFIVIIISGYLHITPGIGTIFDMLFVGFYVDVIESLGWIVIPSSFILQLLLLLSGLVVNCIGIYVYLVNGLGAGPRDGLMLGLVQKTNLSVAVIRSSFEVMVLIAGIFLGGPYGIGTVIVALGMGYILDRTFVCFGYDAKGHYQRTLKDEWETLRRRKVEHRV